MQPDPRSFGPMTRAALGDATLRRNLDHVVRLVRSRREAAFAALEDGPALQRMGNAIKNACLARLPDLLEELEANLTGRGIQVHWAETTSEANRIVLDIARRRGVELVVKGKSMVSEEMGLNAFLTEHGIEALEADLGEFIVQLADQPPSHIVAPAIHLNRQQIAALFHEKLGGAPEAGVEAMTQMARTILREKFQRAGMGITGVNFAIAETGTLALVENEGNGRMVTTVPPVHVALMGLEKVIARLSDLPPLMRLLCRSATGQAISTYFNWISAPRQPSELDGPEEVHLILLDNNRSAIHADAQLRETLACVRCGACLNICPIYARIGGHAYRSVYMGPIGKILSPQLAGLERGGHLAGASTLCGACQEVCPVNIPIPNLLLRLRQELAQPTPAGRALLGAHKGGVAEAMVWKGWRVFHSRAATYRLFTRLAQMFGNTVPAGFGPLRAWTRHRRRPRIAARSLHHLLRDRASE